MVDLDTLAMPVPLRDGLASPPESTARAVRFGPDMLSAYFGQSVDGTEDLFWAQRDSVSEPFREAESLSNLNTSSGEESWHDLSQDGLTMFFARAELGYIRPQTYVTNRSSLNEEFGTPTRIDAAFPGGERINFTGAV